MKKIIILITLLLSSSIFADTAKMLLKLKIGQTFEETAKEEITCFLLQTLEWGNSVNAWKCSNQKGNTFKISNLDVSIGYDYQRNAAFSEYNMASPRGLGKWLFKSFLPEEQVKSGGTLKIFYFDVPQTYENDILVNTDQDSFSIRIVEIGYLQ